MAKDHAEPESGSTAARLNALNPVSDAAQADALKALFGKHAELAGDPSKLMDAGELRKLAGEHASPDMLKAMDVAQQLSAMGEKGEIDFKQLSHIAEGLPVDERLKKLVGSLDSNTPNASVGDVPGLVVDKETGKVKIFGFDGLEVPQQVASVVATAYTMGISLVNGFVWDKAYAAGTAAAGHMNLDALSRHRVGQAAAFAGIFGTTHWPDINTFIQAERDYSKGATNLAQRFAPVLDEMKGGHGVANLFGVRRDENEVIYNERGRMQKLNNAERFKHAVQASGRFTAFIASGLEGQHKIEGIGAGASIVAENEKLANSGTERMKESLRERNAQIKEIADVMMEGGYLSKEEAFKRAEAQLGHTAPGAKKEGKEPAKSNLMHYGAAIATLVAQSVGNNLFGARTNNIQPVSAADMIWTLKKQLDDDPKAASFELPRGMRVDGSKGKNATELPLTEYVMQIFQQHERDCDAESKIGKRLNEKLHETADTIASALRTGDLDGMALIALVGERKVVREGGKSICSKEALHHEVERLKAKLRHTQYVDEREYFNDASFSREQLKEAWQAMSDEEKQFFTTIVSSPILEAAGVEAKEVKTAQEGYERSYLEDVAAVAHNLIQMQPEALERLVDTHSEQALLKKADHIAASKGAEAIESMMHNAGHPNDTVTLDRTMANALVHHALHQGKISELMQHRTRD